MYKHPLHFLLLDTHLNGGMIYSFSIMGFTSGPTRHRRWIGEDIPIEDGEDIYNPEAFQPLGKDPAVKDDFFHDGGEALPPRGSHEHFGGKFKYASSEKIITEQVPRGIPHGPCYFSDKFDEVDRRSLHKGRPRKRKTPTA